MNPSKQKAIRVFLETWNDTWLLDNIGPYLTCPETEALAVLFEAHGDLKSASDLRVSHSESDSIENGDMPEHLAIKAANDHDP